MLKFLCALSVLFLVACGGGGGGSEPQPVQQQPARQSVVIDGDSLAALGSWPSDFHNIAVRGNQIALDVAPSWDAKAATLAPGVYVLIAGTNDARMGVVTVDQAWSALASVWAKARAAGFTVVASTVHSVYAPQGPTTAEAAEAFRIELNRRIRSYPERYDALLELDKLFPDINDTNLMYDRLHFTNAGNQRMRVELAVLLNRL